MQKLQTTTKSFVIFGKKKLLVHKCPFGKETWCPSLFWPTRTPKQQLCGWQSMILGQLGMCNRFWPASDVHVRPMNKNGNKNIHVVHYSVLAAIRGLLLHIKQCQQYAGTARNILQTDMSRLHSLKAQYCDSRAPYLSCRSKPCNLWFPNFLPTFTFMGSK